jgi:transposase
LETCAEAFAIADAARSQGHEVRVVSATLVRTLGVGSRGTKNDRKDAQVLSEVSCRIDLPSVHIPSTESRNWKTECGMREALVGARTQLINTVRGWLRRHAERIRAGGAASFATRVRAHVEAAGQALPSWIARQLETIDHLTAQIAQADRELNQRAISDERCRRLTSVPGVGPVTAVRFVAALDQIGRFGNAHLVESYLGLVPGERSSSETIRHTSITKAGPGAVRWALVQASWCLRRTRPSDPLVLWCKQVEARRGVSIAIVALARKLAGILFAMWRDGTSYEPSHVSSIATRKHDDARAEMQAALALLTPRRMRTTL